MTRAAAWPIRPIVAGALLCALLGLPLLPAAAPDIHVLRRLDERFGRVSRGALPRFPLAMIELNPRLDAMWGGGDRRCLLSSTGDIVALRLRNVGLKSLAELPELETLASLRELDLSNNPLSGVIDVSRFPALEVLELRHTRITGIHGLSRLTSLWSLELRGTQLTALADLRELDRVRNLQVLDLSESPLHGEIDLSVFPHLRSIDLHRTRISAVKGLIPHWLRNLDIADTPVASFTLTGSIREADLSRTAITSLSSLARKDGLSKLVFQDCDFSRLDGLERLTSLQELSLAGCRGVDLRRIPSSGLVMLDLSRASVSHIEALSRFPVLGDLMLTQAQFSGTPAIVAPSSLGSLDVRGTALRKEAVWRDAGRQFQVLDDSGGFVLDPRSWRGRERWNALWAAAAIALCTIGLLAVPARWSIAIWKRRWAIVNTGIGAIYTLLLACGWSFWLPVVSNVLGVWTGIALAYTVLVPVTYEACRRPWFAMSGFAIVARVAIVFYGLALILGPLGTLALLLAAEVGFGNVASSGANLMGIAAYALFLVLPIALLVECVIVGAPLHSWFRERAAVRMLLNGKVSSSSSVLIAFVRPLRQNAFATIGLSRAPKTMAPHDLNVCYSADTAVLAEVERLLKQDSPIDAFVLTVNQADLKSARDWEIEMARRVVAAVYQRTHAAIWLITDRLSELGAAKDDAHRLAPFAPYLHGVDRVRLFRGQRCVTKGQLPAAVVTVAKANTLVDPATLHDTGLPVIFDSAWTPVSQLVRRVFGRSRLPDRVDDLVRIAETTVSFFTIALICERHAPKGDAPKGDTPRGSGEPTHNLAAPSFGEWIQALEKLTSEQQGSRLAHDVRTSLDEPAPPSAALLRSWLKGTGAASSDHQVMPAATSSRRESLSLMLAVRNKITAHGPLTEFAPGEFYRAVLLLCLDLVQGLPWRSATLCLGADASPCQGLFEDQRADAANGVAFRVIEHTGTTRLVPADAWFDIVEKPFSFGIYAGSSMDGVDRYVDPLSGIQRRRPARERAGV